jgi:hypothetical protein
LLQRVERADDPRQRLRRRQRRRTGRSHVNDDLAVRIALGEAMGHMHRQRRLAEPAHPADRADRNTTARRVKQPQQLFHLNRTAGKIRHVRRKLV